MIGHAKPYSVSSYIKTFIRLCFMIINMVAVSGYREKLSYALVVLASGNQKTTPVCTWGQIIELFPDKAL